MCLAIYCHSQRPGCSSPLNDKIFEITQILLNKFQRFSQFTVAKEHILTLMSIVVRMKHEHNLKFTHNELSEDIMLGPPTNASVLGLQSLLYHQTIAENTPDQREKFTSWVISEKALHVDTDILCSLVLALSHVQHDFNVGRLTESLPIVTPHWGWWQCEEFDQQYFGLRMGSSTNLNSSVKCLCFFVYPFS